MAAASNAPDLKQAFETHLRETETQITRLDTIADKLGVSLTGYTCTGMKGCISEGSGWIGEDATSAVKDAGLIMEAQHAEHYETAGYGAAHRLRRTARRQRSRHAAQDQPRRRKSRE